MFSTAIIIFREAFEIALIIGIVLAATRGLPRRHRYIWGGFAAGAAGAFAIALAMEQISNALEGVGQELLNAGILLVAAFFIGWTVVWMRIHAREMVSRIKSVGKAVQENHSPYIALSVVIALAVWREGAEIALFTYSMVATGQDVDSILMGSLLGAAAGIGVGTLLYCGLVKIPTKHLFTVTSALLTFLVCGLVSMAMGYLVAAGYWENYSETMWDTQAILAEKSLLGQTLHILIGYVAQPMQIQVIAYLVTLGLLTGLMFLLERLTQGAAYPAVVSPSQLPSAQ
jgi:high-affinity iron transporter